MMMNEELRKKLIDILTDADGYFEIKQKENNESSNLYGDYYAGYKAYYYLREQLYELLQNN
jgi:hypothetical protein